MKNLYTIYYVILYYHSKSRAKKKKENNVCLCHGICFSLEHNILLKSILREMVNYLNLFPEKNYIIQIYYQSNLFLEKSYIIQIYLRRNGILSKSLHREIVYYPNLF